MKKIFLTLFAALLFTSLFGQAPPQGINYQAVARNSSGNPIIGASLEQRHYLSNCTFECFRKCMGRSF
jgi:hypothetical protein